MDDDTTFSPSEFCTTLRQIMQVANPTVVENPGMLCLCGVEIDFFNRVVNTCKCGNQLTIKVHNDIQGILVQQCVRSGTHATVRVNNMFEGSNPGCHKKADVILEGTQAIDVRVSSVGTQDINMSNVMQPDFIVNKGERQKMSQYTKVKDKGGFEVIPFVIDSQGHMGPSMKKIVSKLSRKHATVTDLPYQIIHQYWSRKYSCRLHKSIAQRVISKVESARFFQLASKSGSEEVRGDRDEILNSVAESLGGLSPRDVHSGW